MDVVLVPMFHICQHPFASTPLRISQATMELTGRWLEQGCPKKNPGTPLGPVMDPRSEQQDLGSHEQFRVFICFDMYKN